MTARIQVCMQVYVHTIVGTNGHINTHTRAFVSPWQSLDESTEPEAWLQLLTKAKKLVNEQVRSTIKTLTSIVIKVLCGVKERPALLVWVT